MSWYGWHLCFQKSKDNANRAVFMDLSIFQLLIFILNGNVNFGTLPLWKMAHQNVENGPIIQTPFSA
jgi:hypothetical protein